MFFRGESLSRIRPSVTHSNFGSFPSSKLHVIVIKVMPAMHDIDVKLVLKIMQIIQVMHIMQIRQVS